MKVNHILDVSSGCVGATIYHPDLNKMYFIAIVDFKNCNVDTFFVIKIFFFAIHVLLEIVFSVIHFLVANLNIYANLYPLVIAIVDHGKFVRF